MGVPSVCVGVCVCVCGCVDGAGWGSLLVWVWVWSVCAVVGPSLAAVRWRRRCVVCGVWFVPKALLPKGKRPGCLPTGTGNRAGLCVLCVCRAKVCRPRQGEGESGRPGQFASGDRAYSRRSRCTPSLSACWCRRSSCNAHATVLPGPRRAFSIVARALAWAYQIRTDSFTTWRRNSVPSEWGPVHSRWASCMEGVHRAAPTAPAQWVPTAGDARGPPAAPPSGGATLRGAGGLAPTRAFEPGRPTGGAPSQAVSRAVDSAAPATHCRTAPERQAVQLLQCTASLLEGSGQCNSCNAPPHCLWAVDGATSTMHVLTALGQWASELLQATASVPGGGGQCNSCNPLPHCPGAVGSATPATHCLTALGQWAVQLLQCTASLPWGSGRRNSRNAPPHCLGAVNGATPAIHCLTALGQSAVELLQCTASLPGGSGQCNSCNALSHCPGAVGSGTSAMHCPTAWGQWAVQLLQCTVSVPRGSGQCNSCNALPHCLGAVGSGTPAMHCPTAWGQ